jgi:hypothetical protein
MKAACSMKLLSQSASINIYNKIPLCAHSKMLDGLASEA